MKPIGSMDPTVTQRTLPPHFRSVLPVLTALALAWAMPAPAAPEASFSLSSIGDPVMAPLMDAWFAEFQMRLPSARKGEWRHDGDTLAVSALMFERADVAPLAREPQPSELAPYDHQFKGDMMRAPLLVQVARHQGRATYLAVNKRAGAPLPEKLTAFLRFVLSREGQAIVANSAGFEPLSPAQVASEVARFDSHLPPLDPAIPAYSSQQTLAGEIRSVGSDGMKSLMDRWHRDFAKRHPSVRKGERWEHFGTLNGFHALLMRETDLAPMGRELWPQERQAYQSALGATAPLEIRVARGGFNTPQRTTAQAIFVNRANPLSRITLPQLRQILSADGKVTRWGQLGLDGQWKDRPIRIYTPPRAAPNSMSIQIGVLDGTAWRSGAQEGSIGETAAAVASDPAAIAFGGFEDGSPDLKTLDVAAAKGQPYHSGSAETVSSGRYPLTRYMYIRLNRLRGEPIAPHIREFLRYVLSREGQEPIRYSGYFPLTAQEVAEELAKLEQ